MNKSIQTLLFQLYSTNGMDQMIHENQKREMGAARELERIGIVELNPLPAYGEHVWEIKRVAMHNPPSKA